MTTVVAKRDQDADAILFICDFSPPKNGDPRLLEPALSIGADFISVAYNPGKSPRANSALAAAWIKRQTGVDVLFTLATRDLNKLATQGMLLGAELFDLDNVVVVKGDDFSATDLNSARPVHDFTPSGLIRSVANMNQGRDFRGRKFEAANMICPGAVIDLSDCLPDQIQLSHTKVESGAQFFLSQPIPGVNRLNSFLGGYKSQYNKSFDQPIFCGVQIYNLDGINFGEVPNWVINDLKNGRSCVEIAAQTIREFIASGFRSFYLIPPIFKGGQRDYVAARYLIDIFR